MWLISMADHNPLQVLSLSQSILGSLSLQLLDGHLYICDTLQLAV